MTDSRSTEAHPDRVGHEEAAERGHDEPLVVVDGLETYYESDKIIGGAPLKAVDGVSFEIGRGETFGIVGESGCGKTTLGRTLLRLEEATAGSVTVNGTDVTALGRRALKRWRQDAQMVYQDPTSSINERLTVGTIVREPLEVHDWGTPSSRRERVSELLERVGLQPEHYSRYPHQFSGGQRQRIGIARALAVEPAFLVLDEPVSALDASVQAKILNLLADLQAEFDLTYLLIAHDLSVVRHICDRVGVMYLGKLMEVGPTERLFQSPSNPYTRALLSAIPQPDPHASANRLTLRGSPPNPRSPPAGCVFSTRCPFKIRQPAHEQLTEQQWAAVEQFRAVLRERETAQPTLLERLRQRVRGSGRVPPIEETAGELFELSAYPPAAREPVETAIGLAAEGEVGDARAVLAETFATVCETETPAEHAVADEQMSRCHRHRAGYDEPGEYRDDADEYLPR